VRWSGLVRWRSWNRDSFGCRLLRVRFQLRSAGGWASGGVAASTIVDLLNRRLQTGIPIGIGEEMPSFGSDFNGWLVCVPGPALVVDCALNWTIGFSAFSASGGCLVNRGWGHAAVVGGCGTPLECGLIGSEVGGNRLWLDPRY
jgi:hypothetical protein